MTGQLPMRSHQRLVHARRLARPLLATRLDALRRRLAARRLGGAAGRRLAGVPPIERVMRRLAAAPGRTLLAALHVHALLAPQAARPRAGIVTGRPDARAPLAPMPARPALHQRLVALRQLVRERIERREMTVQRIAAAVPAPRRTRVEQQQVFTRVQLTLVRPPTTAPAPTRDPVSATAARPAQRRPEPLQPPAAAGAPAPVTLAPQELSRVTDHVIRTLDRRVLSFQERTGRL